MSAPFRHLYRGVIGPKTHPAIRTTEDFDVQRVSCPHEPVGYADVTIPKSKGGAIQIDLKQPLKCNACGRFFRLGTKVVLVGVPVDQPIGAPITLAPDARAGG